MGLVLVRHHWSAEQYGISCGITPADVDHVLTKFCVNERGPNTEKIRSVGVTSRNAETARAIMLRIVDALREASDGSPTMNNGCGPSCPFVTARSISSSRVRFESSSVQQAIQRFPGSIGGGEGDEEAMRCVAAMEDEGFSKA